jgi:glucose/arabinose dehydrogenase
LQATAEVPRRAVYLTIVLLVLGLAPSAHAVVLPPGFIDSFVAAVPAPTALSFAPDGRMLVTTQGGRLYVSQPPGETPVPALDLSARVCSGSERGLLGVAIDPGFASNRFIYLYYTASVSGTCVNRTSRFSLNALNLVDLASELILVDNIPSPAGNHNGGDLQFGKDGYLYISVGDGGCDYAGGGCGGTNDAARDEHVLLGKILRITGNGGIPETNPFQGPESVRCNLEGRTDPGKRCQETFAWGLRNPFRIAFDPNAAGTRFYVNDVGEGSWEEINEGQAGADYGWNLREGLCATGSTNCGPPPAGMTNPIFAYGHSDGCGSITGGAFAPTGLWPAPYDGAYFFADYVCGKIFRLVPLADGTFSRADFASGLGGSSAVAMTFSPSGSTQALYYTTYAGGGEIRKIAHAAPPPPENRPPTAVLTADVTSGQAPLKVAFDGSRSSDPDPGDALTYIWTFGDGSPTTETTSPTVTHDYLAVGVVTASLTVRDDKGATSAPATVQIELRGTPPVATIVSPTTGDRFRVGQTITLHAIATDALGMPLPASSLSWTVILHHGTHTHPFLGPTPGNDIVFTAPAPEDLAAASTSYLEIRLTATDALGLKQTVTQDLHANRVELTFATSPAGLRLQVNAETIAGPTTVTSWEGWLLSVGAPTSQTDGLGRTWLFTSWSDGGAATHSIGTPSSAATYTATFLTPPQNTAAPAILGDARVGRTLAGREGTWIGSDPLFLTYRWLRCDRGGESCAAIAEAISATYTPVPDDFGSTLRLEVTATNPVGSTSATSQPTSRVKHACSSSDCT